MSTIPKFALFDLDGTIATKGKVSPEILAVTTLHHTFVIVSSC